MKNKLYLRKNYVKQKEKYSMSLRVFSLMICMYITCLVFAVLLDKMQYLMFVTIIISLFTIIVFHDLFPIKKPIKRYLNEKL